MRDSRAFRTIANVAALVAVVDQLTKAVVVGRLGPGAPDASVSIVGDWILLEYAENRGAAFGLLSGLVPVLTLASVIVVIALLAQFGRAAGAERWRAVALGLIVGGAAGNLIDRVRLGYVVDFIAIGGWPNFNVADSAISVGVATMLWGWLRLELRSPATERA